MVGVNGDGGVVGIVYGLLARGNIAEADLLGGALGGQGLELPEEAFSHSSGACV